MKTEFDAMRYERNSKGGYSPVKRGKFSIFKTRKRGKKKQQITLMICAFVFGEEYYMMKEKDVKLFAKNLNKLIKELK